jgi:ABC-type Zn uptake system ZnuABC Zn-binding protein ZnuA
MTFQIFFDKLFWLIISLVSGLFVLITKIWAKSFVSECENRLLISEKKTREDFMEALKKNQDEMRGEMKELKKEVREQLEKIDRHQQGNNHQTLSYLEQFKNILNQKK